MNFKEFNKAFSEYFNEKYSNRKLIAYIEDSDSNDVILATRCTQEEAMEMIVVLARKCGITLKELAYMCIAIDSDEDARNALDGIVKASKKRELFKKEIANAEKENSALDADKNSDESQKREYQKSTENDDGDFNKDEIADVISAVLMDVLKSLVE